MAKKKYPNSFTDERGDWVIQQQDGSSQIYHGGFDKDTNYMEITDEADEAVKRRRYVPFPKHKAQEKIEDTLMHREGVPGIDGLEDEPEESAE